MVVGIMQPYFFPYIGYWQLMNAVDEYLIVDDVHYMKNGFINRNKVLVNGEPFNFGFPVRKASQVELSATDARSIGIAAPVRESGDIAGSGACKIVGPCGEIEISEGVIVAKRHIHLTPADAEELGVKDKDVVWVKLDTDGRKAILGDVVVRVSDKFARAMHIDTDESNAVGASGNLMGEIVKI